MRGRETDNRGMALVQALVLVAALAAVAAALLLRADTARQRLQTRFHADQAALYLDSGVAQLQALVSSPDLASMTHRGQPWAESRDDIVLRDAVMGWSVDDLQSRFNVNTLDGTEDQHSAARDAFVRLARAQGLTRATAQRMADALGPDPTARSAAVSGHPLPLPLAHPQQLASLAGGESEAFARLLPLLAALPVPSAVNINTVHDAVLHALMPDITAATRDQMRRRLQRNPVGTLGDFTGWADELIGAENAARLTAVGITTSSRHFTARLVVQLDTIRLQRSVVLTRHGAQGRSRVTLTLPEQN